MRLSARKFAARTSCIIQDTSQCHLQVFSDNLAEDVADAVQLTRGLGVVNLSIPLSKHLFAAFATVPVAVDVVAVAFAFAFVVVLGAGDLPCRPWSGPW